MEITSFVIILSSIVHFERNRINQGTNLNEAKKRIVLNTLFYFFNIVIDSR